MKIPITAGFSWIVLSKRFTWGQCFALLVLVYGVHLVQQNPSAAVTTLQISTEQNTTTGLPTDLHIPTEQNTWWDVLATIGQNISWGVIATIGGCTLSALAGVILELEMKRSTSKKSKWMGTLQLYTMSFLFSAVQLYVQLSNGEGSMFQGYNWIVCLSILLQAAYGIIVSLVVRYMDSISRSFVASGAIVVTCIFDIIFSDLQLSWEFAFGVFLVVSSVYAYSKCAAKPVKQKPE